MALLFREEKINPDNQKKNNFIFLAYAFTPPLPQADYNAAIKSIEDELPIRMWYFADEITTNELMRKVWRSILRSDLAIFDISNGNANVSLELGLSLAIEKNCLTILKTGADNPLGRADLSYAERVEYTSLTELKSKLKQIIIRHTSCGRLISQVAEKLYHDTGKTKNEVEVYITKIMHHVFIRKFIKKADAEEITGDEELATNILYELRDNEVFKLDGLRRAAKWKFSDDYVHKDFMVAG